MPTPRKNKPVTRIVVSLFALFSATLCGCSFFVPAYDNPDSKQYEKQKEKARDKVKTEAHNDPGPK